MLLDANPMRYLCVYITLGFLALTLAALCVCLHWCACASVFVEERQCMRVSVLVSMILSTPKIFSGWLVVQLFRLIDGILHAVKQTSTVYRTILDFC